MSTRSSLAYVSLNDGQTFHVFHDFADNRYHVEVVSEFGDCNMTISEELARKIAESVGKGK